MPQDWNPTTVSQMMAQIRYYQNRINSLSDDRELYDPESGSSSGATHVLEQTSTILSPTTLARFWIAAKYTKWYGYYGKRFRTTICSRRTILYFIEQFKEFDSSSSQDLRPDISETARRQETCTQDLDVFETFISNVAKVLRDGRRGGIE